MMPARAALACAVATLAIAAAMAPVGAAPASRDRRFFSARAGVGIEAPRGWTLSLHTGYPRVLCVLVHPDGSRISLAVDVTAAANATALAAESRPGLAAQGIDVTGVSPSARGGVRLDARIPRRSQLLRQIYLVRSLEGTPPTRQALVLTLTTTPADLADAGAAFEGVLAHMDLEPPVRPDDGRGSPDGGQ